jgi:hypothetical protein
MWFKEERMTAIKDGRLLGTQNRLIGLSANKKLIHDIPYESITEMRPQWNKDDRNYYFQQNNDETNAFCLRVEFPHATPFNSWVAITGQPADKEIARQVIRDKKAIASNFISLFTAFFNELIYTNRTAF